MSVLSPLSRLVSATSITSSLFVLFISTLILAPRSVYTDPELYRIQKYLGQKCHLIADFLTPACSGATTSECCALFSLVDVCRTSCTGDFDSYNSQLLSRLIDEPEFCSQIKYAGKQLCDDSKSEHCSVLRCLMNIMCFTGTTCDSAEPTKPPEVAALRTRHQTRTFELAELSACEATNLVGFDTKNLQICPPVEITSGCSLTDLQYRTVDGSCNSLMHPDWGKSFAPSKRYLPPSYQDGVDAPRTLGVRGRPLKSPRYISHYVASERRSPGPHSGMLMAFGQYLDHDFTGFPVIKLNDSDTQCCKKDLDPSMLVQNGGPCFPIKIDKDEEDFFIDRKCMEFIRSNAAMDENEEFLVPREQINALTSYIDASAVYGSTEEVNTFLRLPD
ncbi:40S ribosomal protein s21, partial [Plakobranchus ocellatus]